jgi:hypothetical protein
MFFGNRKNKLIVFSLFFSIFLFSEGVFAAETGIVPCGHSTPCTLCHLIVGIHNLVDWGLKLLVVAALAAITIAGVMYVVSAGSDTMMTTAKNFVRSSVTGFAFVLGAWLIVSVTMWLISTKADLGIGKAGWHNGSITYDCSTQSSALTGSNATAMTKEGCEKWCDDAQGNTEWTASCKQGCANVGAAPIPGTTPTQADCQKYCNGLPDGPDTDVAGCTSECMATIQKSLSGSGCGVITAGQSMSGWTYSQSNRNSTGYVDCSSFASRAFTSAGCNNPGSNTSEMYQNGQSIQGQSSLKAGDIIVYRNNTGSSGHAAICQNDGCTLIMAASQSRGMVVTQDSSFMFNSSSHQPAKVLTTAQYCPAGSSGDSC